MCVHTRGVLITMSCLFILDMTHSPLQGSYIIARLSQCSQSKIIVGTACAFCTCAFNHYVISHRVESSLAVVVGGADEWIRAVGFYQL